MSKEVEIIKSRINLIISIYKGILVFNFIIYKNIYYVMKRFERKLT